MRASVKTISPTLAKRWLRKNTKNRRIKQGNVERIADDILNDRWHENGQSIVFDVDGTIVDGQHRLLAIVLADRPVRAVVVTGVLADAMPTIDCGVARSFADVCSINGEKSAHLLAATAKHAWRYERGKVFTSIKPSNTDLELFLEARPRLRASATVGIACRKVGQTSVLAFCHYVFSQADPAKAEVFFAGLESGANLGPRSPILHLRNRFLELKRDKNKRLNPPAQIYLTFRAWVAFRDGRQMQKLQLPRDGKLVLPNPAATARVA